MTIINEIARGSIDLVVTKDGNPPEEALRLALSQLFMAVARGVEHSDDIGKLFFPLAFPMKMTLTGQKILWDFTLNFKLENALSALEEQNES